MKPIPMYPILISIFAILTIPFLPLLLQFSPRLLSNLSSLPFLFPKMEYCLVESLSCFSNYEKACHPTLFQRLIRLMMFPSVNYLQMLYVVCVLLEELLFLIAILLFPLLSCYGLLQLYLSKMEVACVNKNTTVTKKQQYRKRLIHKFTSIRFSIILFFHR